MLDESTLKRLTDSVTPGDDLRKRIHARVQARIQPSVLMASVKRTQPSSAFRTNLKDRVFRLIQGHPLAADIQDLASSTDVPLVRLSVLRENVLSRLQPIVQVPVIHIALKWAAAFAVFVLLLRAMPLVFLAPATRANVNIQLIPSGQDVTVFVGGFWRVVDGPEVISGPIMIRTTGDSRATIILNDDGVLRLGENTTIKLHVVADHTETSSFSPTATIIRGQVWALGLLSPVLDSLSIDTLHGTLSLNSGSASVEEDGHQATVAVYDRGATFQHGKQIAFLVTGEKAIVKNEKPFDIMTVSTKTFSESWVAGNLQQDAVHRAEIAKLQQDRRDKMAGILPTSFFYPAKRIAEEVDVLFTLTHDGRAEKRIQQADTRLSEAIALLKEGQDTEAAGPLTEYRDSLIAMASGTGDNLVKFLIKKQIADASVSLNTVVTAPEANAQIVRDAVLEVSAAIPDTALKSHDIEGYVLVDKLAEINRTLGTKNLTGGLVAYAEVRPYLQELLAEKTGAHPLLQKEAKALLVTTSSLIKEVTKGAPDKVAQAVQTDIAQYLPPEPEQILVSEEQLDAQVREMTARIFLFRTPRSRYNQLLYEMSELKGNPNRGTLLRRLYRALPENGLGAYVLTEIKNFGDELREEGK